MIKDPGTLPEPVDGPTPFRTTLEWQLRRLNRMSSALWEVKELLAGSDLLSITLHPNDASVQIHVHVGRPAERALAEDLVRALGWDPEADVVRSGMVKYHYWYGVLAGFRAYAVWSEYPAASDSQGREQLPAEVGVGNAAADAEHLQQLAGAASGMPFRTEGPGAGLRYEL